MVQIDENVMREIINHSSLRHPNIIRFKEVRTCIGMLALEEKRVIFLDSEMDLSYVGVADTDTSRYRYGICCWRRAL